MWKSLIIQFKKFTSIPWALVVMLNITLIMNKDRKKAIHMLQEPKTLEEVKQYTPGGWESLSVELRPTEDRTRSGKIEPTYLKRHFKYLEGDQFVGTITLFGDNFGTLPLMESLREPWFGAKRIPLLRVPGV